MGWCGIYDQEVVGLTPGWLVPGWVTLCGQVYHLPTARSTQSSISPEYLIQVPACLAGVKAAQCLCDMNMLHILGQHELYSEKLPYN